MAREAAVDARLAGNGGVRFRLRDVLDVVNKLKSLYLDHERRLLTLEGPMDTERTNGLPSTNPPPPETEEQRAAEKAFVRSDAKMDRVLEMLDRLTLLVEDVFAGQEEMKTRLAALEQIPSKARAETIPPPRPDA